LLSSGWAADGVDPEPFTKVGPILAQVCSVDKSVVYLCLSTKPGLTSWAYYVYKAVLGLVVLFSNPHPGASMQRSHPGACMCIFGRIKIKFVELIKSQVRCPRACAA
jgi:hypothetical protein